MGETFGILAPVYRLPAATHVGAVVLQIADLDHSIGYYERVLGLRVLERGRSTAALGPHDDDRVLVRLEARPGLRGRPTWQPNAFWAVALGCLSALGVLHLSRVSEFLYFQF